MTNITVVEIRTGNVVRSSGARISTSEAESMFLKIIVEALEITEPVILAIERVHVFTFSIRLRGCEIALARIDWCPNSCPVWTFTRPDIGAKRFSACCTVGECLAYQVAPDQLGLFGEAA